MDELKRIQKQIDEQRQSNKKYHIVRPTTSNLTSQISELKEQGYQCTYSVSKKAILATKEL